MQVSRGDYAGTEGKITKIDYKNFRVHVEGVTGEKADGTTHLVPIHPSKVSVTKLNTDDKWRKRRLTKKPMEPEAKEEGVKEKAEAAEGVERAEAAEKENADIEEKEEEERA